MEKEAKNADTHDQSYFDSNLERITKYTLSGRNILISGSGGTGKSYTLRHIAKQLTLKGIKVYMTALTGVAALNLAGDRSVNGLTVTTLHKFSGTGTAQLDIPSLIARVRSKPMAMKNWMKCQVLIIDEFSMLGGGLFAKLDAIAKAIRRNENPFGGIQLILSGDPLQIEPIKDSWAFTTEPWKELNLRPFVFEVPYRYDDINFFHMLLRIRTGTYTEEDVKTIRGRVRANEKMQELLTSLAKVKAGEIIKPTMFFSKNADVDAFNMRELDKLPGDEYEFVARDSFTTRKGMPIREEYIKMLDDTIPQSIVVKVGAQVMLKKNLDVDAGLVNGSRGVVSEIIEGEAMVVKFLCGEKMRVDLQSWDYEDKYALATRVQIPFTLAWGCTIHRSQGCTLDYAVVDLGASIFCSGQAYVALSRCRNLEGLFISKFTPNSIIVSKEALKFVFQINKMHEIENALEDEQ
jgi:ATP-dependent DNA helicase PIF1